LIKFAPFKGTKLKFSELLSDFEQIEK